jgi:hypothetical protein
VVFEWLGACVAALLDHLGIAAEELKEASAMARRVGGDGAELRAVEERAWGLWVHRSTRGTAFTAVAQLLFAVSRADRSSCSALASAGATPLCLLERLESRSGEVHERAVAHFAEFVTEGRADPGRSASDSPGEP